MPLSAQVVDRIIAIVDSDIITLVDLNRETASYRKKIEKSPYPESRKLEMIEKVNMDMLNIMIDHSLTRQEAEKFGITVSDEEVETAVDNMRESRSLSQKAFGKALKNEGFTLSEYQKKIKKQILQTRLINHAVKSKVIILESDIKNYYQSHGEKYSGIKKYYLRNILLDNREKMEQIRGEIKGKDDFIRFAQNYSMAPNAQDGGDLGLFDITDFPSELKDEISKLSRDQFTQVISTARGFQIFYIEDIVLEGGKTIEQAHDEIYTILYNQSVEKKFITWLDSLKKKAHIKIMF